MPLSEIILFIHLFVGYHLPPLEWKIYDSQEIWGLALW